MTLDSPFGYVLSGESIITLETTESKSEINTVSGRHVISIELSCLNNLEINVVSPSAQLSLFNLLTASNKTLSKRGEGALTLTSTSRVPSHNVTVATEVLQVDGTLAPGTGVGALTINGDISLKTEGRLQIEINDNGADLLVLDNLDLSYDNIYLDVILIDNPTPGD